MLSTGSPITFITRPSVCLPTGTDTGPPRLIGLHAAHHAFGGLQRDGAHAAFADVLRHFDNHVDGSRHVEAFAGDADGGVDDRDLVLRELNVDGRSGDLDHFAFRPALAVAGCHKYSYLG